MHLSLIAALSTNRVIGVESHLPWHLPADLKHFKSLTLGKPIIMGRKTYESIGKPLPQRRNMIISHRTDFQAAGCEVFGSLEQALNQVKDVDEVMIVGGSQLFTQALPKADRLYLTIIHQEIEGDTFFPKWDKDEWQEISREDHSADATNPYFFSFLILDRTLKR